MENKNRVQQVKELTDSWETRIDLDSYYVNCISNCF